MTGSEARALLLSLDGVTEAPHFARLAYRAGGPIFATLGLDDETLNLKYSPEDQAVAIALHPDAVAPVAGGWGRKGYTAVSLHLLGEAEIRALIEQARLGAPPKRRVQPRSSG